MREENKLYNFLVTAQRGAWNLPAYEYPLDRFGEYTASAVLEKYKDLNASAIEQLKSFPVLFAYEGGKEDLRVGYIKRIKVRSSTVVIEYELESRISVIPAAKLAELKIILD